MEYTIYKSTGNQMNLEEPGTTTFKIAKLQTAIRPIWEYRADKFWNAFKLKDNVHLPMVYTETGINPPDYKEDIFKNITPSWFLQLLQNSNSNNNFNRRHYFKSFPTINEGTSSELEFVQPSLTDVQKENVIIDSNQDFLYNGNNVANGEGLGSPFPCRVKINLKVHEADQNKNKTFSLKGNNSGGNYDYKAAFLQELLLQYLPTELLEDSIISSASGGPVLVKYYPLESIYEDSYSAHPLSPSDTKFTFEEDSFGLTGLSLIDHEVVDDFDWISYRLWIKEQIKTNRDKSMSGQKTNCIFVKIVKTGTDGVVFFSTSTKRNFYLFPNADGEIEFNDTQVLPLKEYTYEFFTYHLVNYENKKPCIIEIPQGRRKVKIKQPPQNRPYVEFKNLRDKKNKVQLALNLSTNQEISKTFFGITVDEAQDFSDDWSLFDPGGLRKSYYQYENEPGSFEIYKMHKQPTSYFNISEISNPVKIVTNGISTLAFTTEIIEPFTDYYYMIRSINSDGVPSNPSPIYKVHSTMDIDDTFLHVESVGFKKPPQNEYMNEKSMAKMLQIIPATMQVMTGSGENGPYDTIDSNGGFDSNNQIANLGLVSTSIWDEKRVFKLRLTSRKTGKKIDLNLRFKLEKQQITQ